MPNGLVIRGISRAGMASQLYAHGKKRLNYHDLHSTTYYNFTNINCGWLTSKVRFCFCRLKVPKIGHPLPPRVSFMCGRASLTP